MIHHLRQAYGVKRLCAYFGVSRAAYYAWEQGLERARDPREQLIEEAYRASRGTYGYRRIQIWLAAKRGIRLNHKTVWRLMNRLGLRSIARRRKPVPSMADLGLQHRYANILERNFTAARPNQKWVTDVTFVRTRQGWAYLVVIKDLHDGFIVAHQLGQQNSVALVTQTLQQAVQTEAIPPGLILHSDQGHQYSSPLYAELTSRHSIRPSMSRRGNCWDNAPVENFFSHLKEEALRHTHLPSFQEARHLIDDYVHFYNHQRIQLKTRQTPYELRCLSI